MTRLKIGIAQIERGSHQGADIDRSALSKQHAIGIEYEHLSIGTERPEYRARVLPYDTIESDGAAVGLVEAHRLIRPDRKAAPVDREILALLVDDRTVAALG